MIEFEPEIRERSVFLKLVRKGLASKNSIPSLSHLLPARSYAEVLELARSWQKLQLGAVIESRENGRDYVFFAIEEKAKQIYLDYQRRNPINWFNSFNRSDWISFGSLIVAFIALLKD